MDRKQKEQLRFLLKARKRADKVLAKRRQAEFKKMDYARRKEYNQELIKQFTSELTETARESGILALAEQAALQHGGSLAQDVSCFIDYGLSSSCLQQAYMESGQGELRASHLCLRITWEEAGVMHEAEIRVHKKGNITFHNSYLPVLPFLWRNYPQVLERMLASALQHPRPPSISSRAKAS